MSNSKEMMNKAYIDHKLAGIFEPMVNQIVQERPSDTVILSIPNVLIVQFRLIS
jgi:hypothetical protein